MGLLKNRIAAEAVMVGDIVITALFIGKKYIAGAFGIYIRKKHHGIVSQLEFPTEPAIVFPQYP
jgi:hypothetical protein